MKEKEDKATLNWHEWEEVRRIIDSYSSQTQRKIRQKHIDFCRYRAMMWGLKNYLKKLYEYWEQHTDKDSFEDEAHLFHAIHSPKPQHLWFKDKNLNSYELRDGNPPSDSERPMWARGLKLEIDYKQLPVATWAKCAPGGRYADILDDWQQYGTGKRERMVGLKEDTQLIVNPYDLKGL
jgi:hypothetical protein